MSTVSYLAGRFDQDLPVIGLGCWQIGGNWGTETASEDEALAILEAAYAAGTRFFDTADVYGNGRSESLLGRFRAGHSDIVVATKLGRRGIYPDGYGVDSLRAATDRSRDLLGMDCLDLTQLHCVPTGVLRQGEVFDWLRDQREAGLIRAFGASVESVEEGLICLEQEGLASLQIIFNIFRQKPLEELIPRAQDQGVDIIVRLPLASGLLAGKFTADSTFAEQDHRNFNQDGASFNVGETFAGLPFVKGVVLADALKHMLPAAGSMAQQALRWVLDQPGVSVAIPGASRTEQAIANAAAAEVPSFGAELLDRLRGWYADEVHAHIRGPY